MEKTASAAPLSFNGCVLKVPAPVGVARTDPEMGPIASLSLGLAEYRSQPRVTQVIIGTEKKHASHRRDRILRFFLRPEIGQFSPPEAISLPNYTVNLEKREKITGENSNKKSSGDGAAKLQISVPCRGRTCPEIRKHPLKGGFAKGGFCRHDLRPCFSLTGPENPGNPRNGKSRNMGKTVHGPTPENREK